MSLLEQAISLLSDDERAAWDELKSWLETGIKSDRRGAEHDGNIILQNLELEAHMVPSADLTSPGVYRGFLAGLSITLQSLREDIYIITAWSNVCNKYSALGITAEPPADGVVYRYCFARGENIRTWIERVFTETGSAVDTEHAIRRFEREDFAIIDEAAQRWNAADEETRERLTSLDAHSYRDTSVFITFSGTGEFPLPTASRIARALALPILKTVLRAGSALRYPMAELVYSAPAALRIPTVADAGFNDLFLPTPTPGEGLIEPAPYSGFTNGLDGEAGLAELVHRNCTVTLVQPIRFVGIIQ